MKKNRVLILILSILSVFLLWSCKKKTTTTTKKTTIPTSLTTITTNAPTVKPSSNTNTTKPVPTESGDVKSYELYSGNYYDSVTSEMLNDSTALKAELNRIVNNGFTGVDYDTAFNKLVTIDSYDENTIECFYSGIRMEADRTTGVWNREHIWCKTYGFKSLYSVDKYDAYSDLHHLRATEKWINSMRNDSYFDDLETYTSSDDYGNRWISTVFDPRDEVKGDIARMLIYMVVKYEDPNVLDLELTDDVSLIDASKGVYGGLKPSDEKINAMSNESDRNKVNQRTYRQDAIYIGRLNTLLKWAYEDPVDERELSRNDEIYSVQHNRNPFIDHPEYVYYLYKEVYSSMNYTIDLNNYNYYVLSDKDAINAINEKINSLPQVLTIDDKETVETIRTTYNSLGQVTKSFVTGYKKLVEKEAELQILIDLNDDERLTKSALFDFLSESGKTGELNSNSIVLTHSSNYAANTGLAVTRDKNDNPFPNTLTATNVYSTIKAIKFNWAANKGPGEVKVVVTDKNGKQVEGTFNYLKTTVTSAYLDISSLDYEGVLTIVVTNLTRGPMSSGQYQANTLRIKSLEFVLSIPN